MAMGNLFAKAKPNPAPPDPADLANRVNNQRSDRLAGGGRNSTFLGAAVEAAQAGVKPKAQLTGLDGG
jgi:hypothetical protein